MQKRLIAHIYGRVQMVMFRDFACRNARRLGLVGYVQNIHDGSVLAVAEGEEATLREFLALLRKGPILANVERVDESFGATTSEFVKFNILYAE